jgi:hypothetical protein
MPSTPSPIHFNLLDHTIAGALGLWDGLLRSAGLVDAAAAAEEPRLTRLEHELEEPGNNESSDKFTCKYQGSFSSSSQKLRDNAQLKTRKQEIVAAEAKFESICVAQKKLADQIRYKSYISSVLWFTAIRVCLFLVIHLRLTMCKL